MHTTHTRACWLSSAYLCCVPLSENAFIHSPLPPLLRCQPLGAAIGATNRAEAFALLAGEPLKGVTPLLVDARSATNGAPDCATPLADPAVLGLDTAALARTGAAPVATPVLAIGAASKQPPRELQIDAWRGGEWTRLKGQERGC